MKVETVPIAKVKPYAQNPRRNEGAVAKVAASIREFGFRQPIVVDKKYVVVVGHTRLLAALELGLKHVPVHVAHDLTPTQARAYRIADNRLAEEAEWDEGLLKLELDGLCGDGFDLDVLGFDEAELVRALSVGDVVEDDVPDPPANPVTKLGDLWELGGGHRLLCGDARSGEIVRGLLNGAKPGLVFTDPPYGINAVKGGHIGGAKPFGCTGNAGGKHPFGGRKGRVHGLARKAIIATNLYEPIIGDDGVETAVAAYSLCRELAIPKLILWGANYYADRLPASRCWVVWDKEVTGSFADVEIAWTNLDSVARLFRHQWSGLMKASERGERRVHPTQKPVALAGWCLAEFSEPHETVLDLFLGSGSTLMACEQTEHPCLGLELSPAYCDVIVERWQNFTGKKAKRRAAA